MRNNLREAIRQEVKDEVRQEVRDEVRHGMTQPDGHRDPEADAVFRVVLRPIASSLPLGFFAFTVGTMLLTALELRWVPVADSGQLAVLVLAFVVPLEALSGLFAFLARDSGAATGLTTLSAAWAATAISLLHWPPGALSPSLAVFLLTLTMLMLVMAAASVTGKPLFGLLLLIGACRFALTGVYQATGNAPVEQVAGWLGVPLGAFALYGGLALLLEEGTQRMVLPIGRRGRSRTSLEGSFAHQVQQAELEPGVRRQL
jgi:succinate-acetate transporter protein